jgi:hypothetical protein
VTAPSPSPAMGLGRMLGSGEMQFQKNLHYLLKLLRFCSLRVVEVLGR